MKRFIHLLGIIGIVSFCQGQTINLTFTGNETCSYVAFDSVKIENISRSCDTILYFPDTVMTLQLNDIKDITKDKNIIVTQNYPNPFTEKTRVNIYLPATEKLSLDLVSGRGSEVAQHTEILNQGLHQFEITGENSGIYFLIVRANGYSKPIKLIQVKNARSDDMKIEYLGIKRFNKSQLNIKNEEASFSVNIGDELLISGFYNNKTTTISDTPEEDIIYNLDFSHPECPETITDFRDGYTYPVKKIGCQCWIAENLRFLPDVSDVDEGSSTNYHYYVYGNYYTSVATALGQENFNTYGVLYNWNAAMQSLVDNQGSVKGICPEGWRLPNDNDWKTLEKHLGMSGSELDNTGYRGTNEGSKLAGTMLNWFAGYLTADAAFGTSGFNALPGGGRYFTGNYDYLGASAIFWTSTKYGENNAWIRSLHTHYSSAVYRGTSNVENGFSVRCIKAD